MAFKNLPRARRLPLHGIERMWHNVGDRAVSAASLVQAQALPSVLLPGTPEPARLAVLRAVTEP
jgi:hypothetical protein